jgi:hypothetical protein
MSYLAAVAAITGNLPAYDIPIELQERGEARPYLTRERVALPESYDAPVETAYTSLMKNYYNSVWENNKPTTIIVIEK